MKKLNKWLASLLAVQLLVAGGLILGNQSQNGDFSAEPLLAVSEDSVDKIIVSTADASVTLIKKSDSWHIDAQQAYPAAQSKLSTVLNQISQLQTRWPVATSKSAHARFNVTDESFERKIQLFSGNKELPTLYIGTSPGFKQSHVRVEKHDEVYALNLNAYDFPAKPNDWLDRSLLAVNNVTRVKIESYVLRKENSDWLIASPDESETWTANVQKASELSRAMENFKVSGIAEQAPNFEEPSASDNLVTLEVEGDAQRTLQFLKQENNYYVKEVGSKQVFTLSSYEFNRLAGIESSDLIIANAEPSEESANDTADSDQAGS